MQTQDFVRTIQTLATLLTEQQTQLDTFEIGRYALQADVDYWQAECTFARDRAREAEIKSNDDLRMARLSPAPMTFVMTLFAEPAKFQAIVTYMASSTHVNKLADIQKIRELTGWGLKQARDFVEAYPPSPDVQSTGT